MSIWPRKKLGTLTTKIGSGATPRGGNATYVGSGISFIRSQNVLDHEMKLADIAHITDEAAHKLRGVTVEADDVLINITGDSIARCCVVDTAVLPARVNQHVAILRTTSELDARFLQKFLVTPTSKELLIGISSGGTRKALTRSDLSNLDIPTPPLEVQRAIAEVLGALDDKIAANTQLGRTVETLGSAKFTWLGLDVEPADDVIMLDDLFDLNPRRTVTSDSPTIIDMKALPTDRPLVEEWSIGARKGGTRFKNGDTLVARITPCLENRKTAFVDFLDDEEVGIGSTEFIVMRSKNDLPLGLSYFMAISERFRDFAIQNLVGTSGRQRVSAADLSRHTLSPVDVSELQEFGKWANDNLRFLGSLREENRTLATIRDALLPQLMSGKLRVKDAERVVEDKL